MAPHIKELSRMSKAWNPCAVVMQNRWEVEGGSPGEARGAFQKCHMPSERPWQPQLRPHLQSSAIWEWRACCLLHSSNKGDCGDPQSGLSWPSGGGGSALTHPHSLAQLPLWQMAQGRMEDGHLMEDMWICSSSLPETNSKYGKTAWQSYLEQ